MSIRRWAGIGVAGIALAVLSGVITARAMRPESLMDAKAEPKLPALYIADDKQDLGDVWESSDAILTVPISNRTDKPIEILDFESSCDCGEISPRQLTVPANGTANVTVKMDLTRRTPQQMGMVRRKFTYQMKPVTAGMLNSCILDLSCTSRSAITTNRCGVYFGDYQAISNQSDSRILIVTAHEPVMTLATISELGCIKSMVKMTSEGEWQVQLSLQKTETIGYWSGRVLIEYRLASGEFLKLPIDVSGRGIE